jgi:hypothetical protein
MGAASKLVVSAVFIDASGSVHSRITSVLLESALLTHPSGLGASLLGKVSAPISFTCERDI